MALPQNPNILDGKFPRRFLCDEMLKGLAKWLRFLGFSTEITANTSRIMQVLENEPSAIFLTRSRKHARIFPENSVFVLQSDDVAEQLQELNREFSLFNRMKFLSLCSVCNIPIEPIEKAEIQGQIPERVWESFQEFWKCPVCGRIYWEGGHVQRLKDKLRRMGVPVLPDSS